MNPAPAPHSNPVDHWRKFRRLMLVMGLAGVATAAFAIAAMRADGAPLELHFLLAVAGGIILSLLLAGALMGLAFFSSRSGHDESVNAPDD